MKIKTLKTSQIEFINSRYRFDMGQTSRYQDEYNLALENSLKNVGILNPLVVHKTDNKYHLIDGFKRLDFAMKSNLESMNCKVLSDISDLDAVQLLLLSNFNEINDSIVLKIKFLSLVKSLKINDDEIIKMVLPLLGFEPHKKIVSRCETVASLPNDVLDFCHEKKFSFKQCYNLTRHPSDLIKEVFLWKHDLVFTASILDSILEDLKDYLKFNDKSVEDFLQLEQVKSIFESKSLNPQLKTKELRTIIKELRFPIISGATSRMNKTVSSMNLPKELTIRWDPILEDENLSFNIIIKDENRLKQISKTLTENQFLIDIKSLLKEL